MRPDTGNRPARHLWLAASFTTAAQPEQAISMALIPRWQYMTDDAKALTKRVAISALAVIGALVLLRALLPWVILAVVLWWIWKAIARS